jgi:hypothetical protein
MGGLQFGTLHDYRRQEAHAPSIGDLGEGKKKVSHRIGLYNSGAPRLLDEAALRAFNFFGENPSALREQNITILDSTLQTQIDHPDCFVLCAATTASRDLMKRLGYDSCVEITDWDAFCKELTPALTQIAPSHIKTIGVGSVVYEDRSHIFDGTMGTHPAFVKIPEFGWQNEIRSIWIPHDTLPITPTRVICHRALKYCRRLY